MARGVTSCPATHRQQRHVADDVGTWARLVSVVSGHVVTANLRRHEADGVDTWPASSASCRAMQQRRRYDTDNVCSGSGDDDDTTPTTRAQSPTPSRGLLSPGPLRDDDDAGTQPTSKSSSSCKGSTEPSRGDDVDPEPLRDNNKDDDNDLGRPRGATM